MNQTIKENKESKVNNKFKSDDINKRKNNLMMKLKKILKRSREKIFKD